MNKAVVVAKPADRDRRLGIAAAILSALIYGLMPAVTKLAYAGGSNGITMTFTRGFLIMPVLYGIARARKIPMKLSRRELPATVCVCFFGAFLTTCTLYSAYAYIDVGSATALHYIYPVTVTLGSLLFFHERMQAWKLAALALGFSGTLMFFGMSTANAMPGILLATSSGFFYAILLLGIEHTSAGKLHSVKLSFYSSMVSGTAALVFGLCTHTLHLQMTAAAWSYSLLVSIMIGMGAFPLLQTAIVKCGAPTTSILSMLEPVTGILFGWLILGESLSVTTAVGAGLILLSVGIVTLFSLRK